MNFDKSKTNFDITTKLTPGGVSSPVRAFKPFPLFIDKGEGCYVTDVDGNKYIDLCMAYGPLITGHSCKRIMDAVKSQMDKGTAYGAPSEPELELIKALVSIVPSAEKVRLTCSGTESTMHSIRLARGYTGKDGVIKLKGGYHGAHDSLLVNAGPGSVECDLDYVKCVPGSDGIPKDTAKNTYMIDYNNSGSLETLLDKNEDIGCIIMEPVMGNAGVITPNKGYLEEVRKITSSHGVLLIFDEVITGFRLGKTSAQGLYNVTPDITSMGKVIGGGFPGGAFMGRDDIMSMIAPEGPVYAAGTFAGNPISTTAGLEQIKIMSENDNYSKLNKKTERLVSSIADSMIDNDIKGCVHRAGSIFSIFFGLDSVENGTEAQGADKQMFEKMFKFMLNNGIYLPPSVLEIGFISIAHDEESITKIAEVFDDFLKSV